jgi:autotransporter family porin
VNIILKLTKLNHGISYKNFFIFFSILILSILLFSSTSHAATFNSSEIYVNGSSGSDSNNGFSWSTAKLTIKNATGTVANGGTVNIANGVYSGTGNTNININKNITIKGQSQYGTIIDGQNTSQILHINNGCNVIITNLTLGRGYVQQLAGGGAIYNEGTLIVYDSRFMYNTANPYYDAYAITKIPKCGGAIYNSGLLGLERCTFLNNTAAHYNYNVIYYSLGNGGAIVNNGTLVVDSSVFVNNTAAWEGGAIFNSGVSYVSNSTFLSNSAGYGGAISGALDTNNSVTVTGSYFLNNAAFPVGSESTTAEGRGGAIYGTCTIENCGFMNNTATKGGAINGRGNCSINSSYFLNNIAINNNTQNVAFVYGGAVYNSEGTLIVNNTNFANNLATGTSSIWCYGGAVCTSDHLSINNCTFTNNSVTGSTNEGGAISIITNGNCSVNNSTFTNNTACYGGAISNDGIINNLNNSSFISNSANNGGAINNNGVFYGINNTTFLNNTATNNGGAIRNVKVLGNITHSNFTGNNATYNGGAIYQNTYTLTINDSNFTGNKASKGGACYNDIGEVGINKCNYTNNDANNSGGAIYNYHGGCHVSNCTLNSNTANQYGGAIYNDNDLSVLTVYGSNLINNAASIGSAIYTMSNGTQIEFNRISGNSGNYDIHTALGIDASNNWWGTNFDGTDPITAGRINDDIINIVSPWIVLMVTANPTTIGSNGNSTIIADLSHDSRVLSDPTHPQLYYHSSGGHLPDGIPISFSTTLGIITSGSSGLLTNEKAQMILNSGNIKGTADVSATIDDETVHSNVIINTGSIITPGAQLNDAVDNTALPWTTGGNSPWFSETDTTNYGGDAAQSGDINDSQSNWIQTSVTGPGTLSFYWKVSSESGYDYLKFFVDGTQIYNITGNVDWQQKTYTLTSGTHTLKWEYSKDVSVSSGLDCGWLDKVQWTTDNTAPTVTGSNPANFATNIPKDKTITITFNEAIRANNLNNIVLQSSTGTIIPITTSINGNTLTITHPLLSPGTFYKIFLNTDCIRDLAGNALQTKVLGFTTSA